MIWIFEELGNDHLSELRQLEPFMDIEFDRDESGGRVIYRTFCAGHEIRDGKIEEIRKIRFFGLDAVKQGFISDDILGAKLLCYSMRFGGQLNVFSDSTAKQQEILNYLETHDSPWLKLIAVPVRAFIDHYREENPRALDWLDLDELKKWNIDIHRYIERGKIWL